MFDHTLASLIEQLKAASNLDEVREAFGAVVTNMGFRHFTYHVVKIAGVGNHLPYFITTYPQSWVDHYVAENYVHLDPLIHEGPKRLIPFLWEEVAAPHMLDKKQSRLYAEAADIQIAGGLSIPIHGRNGEFAMMSVVPDETMDMADLANSRHRVHLLALYYHQHVGGLLLERFLKSPRQRCVLTEREKECLKWTALGKSAAEIGDILNLAETTVIYYLESAKRKLGVYNKTHAVVRSIMLGLVGLE